MVGGGADQLHALPEPFHQKHRAEKQMLNCFPGRGKQPWTDNDHRDDRECKLVVPVYIVWMPLRHYSSNEVIGATEP